LTDRHEAVGIFLRFPGKFFPPPLRLFLQTLATEQFLAVAHSLLPGFLVNVSLFQAASALDANSRWQEIIADNLASGSVPGYKQQQLSQAAIQAGLMPAQGAGNASSSFSVPKTSTSTNFSPGELKYTGNNTDVAIEGKGFFEVQLPNGVTGLTRDGEFRVNSQNQLVTKESYPVMGASGAIQLSRDASGPLSISSTGAVSQGSEKKGQLKVTDVDNPQALTQISGGYFMARDPKAGIHQGKANLREGYLESSNTSTLTEMASMMTASRGFEVNQKVIQIQDDRLNRVITELGNPT
jgi:flagellar basal-body rod protein FlgG